MIDTKPLHIDSMHRQNHSQPSNSLQGPVSGPPPLLTEAHAFLQIGRFVELMHGLGKLAYTRDISIDGSAGS
jgi:hypothetical protein